MSNSSITVHMGSNTQVINALVVNKHTINVTANNNGVSLTPTNSVSLKAVPTLQSAFTGNVDGGEF